MIRYDTKDINDFHSRHCRSLRIDGSTPLSNHISPCHATRRRGELRSKYIKRQTANNKQNACNPKTQTRKPKMYAKFAAV